MKHQILLSDDKSYVSEAPKGELKSNLPKRPNSRAATEMTRTPTPKMLLDMTSGAIHWPVYQVGGQSGSGMMLSTKGLVKPQTRPKPEELKEEPGRENFSLGELLVLRVQLCKQNGLVTKFLHYLTQNTKLTTKAKSLISETQSKVLKRFPT